MKRFYFIFILLFSTSVLFSQPWINNLPQNKSKGSLTFFDYKNAFNTYWAPYNVKRGYYYENGVKKKAIGWKQFKRWEYNMESKVNPTTGEFPTKTAQQIYDEYKASSPQPKMATSASWTTLGSNSSGGGYAGIGRISCIAFHPTDYNTYWVGAATGGLWVTTNNGTSWTCLTDNNGVLAISDIIIPSDYATSNTIYIATGDRDGWDNNSVGVLKSTNGGTTWNTTGLSYGLSNSYMVNRLLLNPGNNQSIIAATSNGVYKTINGGTTWSTQLTSTNFIDLEFKPGDTNTIYGCTETYGNSKIYVTTNGGSSWTQAFTNANAYRIELAVTVNQPTWVYALVSQSDNGLYGIYKSTDNGTSYTQVFAGTTKNLLGWYANGSDAGGQGFYDLSLAVSPTNASILLVGGVNTHKSTNGGTSWTCSNCWTAYSTYNDGSYPVAHADKHCLKFRSNGDLFETNDGGVYISTNSGTTWTDKTNGMVINEMYKLSNSQTVSTEVLTGLQDNGTKLVSGGSWSDVMGGDGAECIIDYSNANTQYGEYVQGDIEMTTNHWTSSTDISANIATTPPTGAWVTPYIIDPVNHQTLYAGFADVYKTTNSGTSWTKISTMNTSNNLRSMAIAPSNTQVLYVADQTTIWKTVNGGTSWTNVTGTLPVSSANITYIAVKNDDANTLWVTMDGYNATRVYQSANGGTSWTDISTGLPQLPTYSIVQNKQSTTEVQLYVGTELGVYLKKGTANWVAFNIGLPNVKIGELEIYYDSSPQNSKLRAATYGRGLWETYVYYNVCTPPTTQATTLTSSAITINSMTIGWTRGNGNKVLVVTHQSSAVNSDPVFGTSYTANAAFGSGTQIGTGNYVVYNGKGTSVNITGLTPGTAYYYAVYEFDSTTYCYKTPALTGNYSTNTCTAVTITTQPANSQSFCTPVNNILFSVAATTGTLPLTYQWQYNNSGTWANVTNGTPTGAVYTNPTTDSMKVSGITASATYQYRCYLTNCSASFNATSNTASLTITTKPTISGTITGATTVCQGQSSITYTVPAITNATTYVWTLPTGATGTSTTNSITVSYGTSATSGNITLHGNNTCGNSDTSTLTITVNPLPLSAGSITGTTTVCQGQSLVTYTVPAITNASTYVWTLPTGATGSSTTDSIIVNYGTSAVSGNITIHGNNSCGNGSTSSLAITVNPLPVSAGSIIGTTSVCQGQDSVIYSVPTITNASTYIWTLPTGTTGSSTTSSITINYGTSAVSGNITVHGNNSCGNGNTSTLAITVNPIPPTPVISKNGNTLTSNAASGNQWYNLATGILNSTTAQTYMPQLIGDYFVIVTLNGCVSDSSNIIHYDNTGISSNTQGNFNLKVIPNPFNDKTTFTYTLNESKHVRLSITDVLGREIKVLSDSKQERGDHKLVFEAEDLSSGVYYYNINIENKTISGKIVLSK